MQYWTLIISEIKEKSTEQKLIKILKKYKTEDPTIKVTGISISAFDKNELTRNEIEQCFWQTVATAFSKIIKDPPYMDEVTQEYIAIKLQEQAQKIFKEIKEDPTLTETCFPYNFEEQNVAT